MTTPMAASEAQLRRLAPDHRLRRLELAITRRLDGLLHGEYLGLVPGLGSEVAGCREYRPGEDEVRRMDWAVTARTATPHVRETHADRDLTTWALVDATASMDFGTAHLEKRELAVAALAAVGFLTARAGNSLGVHVLRPDRVWRVPAHSGRAHLWGVLRTLLTLPRPAPGGAAGPSLATAIDAVGRAAVRRGFAVVISDFLDGLPDSPDGIPEWEKPLRRLATRHQVLAIEVSDPREEELPDIGIVTLIDPESGRRRDVSTADRRVRARFAEAAAAQRAAVAASLRRAGAVRLALRTDRDWIADIVRHVHVQRRLAAAAPPLVTGGART